MDHNWVTAIGTGISAIATIALVIIAWVQLHKLRQQIKLSSEQERRRNTLQACQRVETDAILNVAMRNLRRASQNGTDYTNIQDEHRLDCITVLNYLDGVAVGVEQKVYIEEMAKDYLEAIVHKAVQALVKGESGEGWKAGRPIATQAQFPTLYALHERWSPKTVPKYKAED